MQKFQATRRCVWDANEEEGVAREVLEGVPKPRALTSQLQNTTRLYVCENHKALSPWLE